jgi:hypothetical protein
MSVPREPLRVPVGDAKPIEAPARDFPGARSAPADPLDWVAKPIPPSTRDQVAAYLGVVRGSLEVMAEALILVAERHERNYEIHGIATVLAGWIREDIDRLAPFVERYGLSHSDQPHKLRAAVLGGVRGGLHGLLADLTDLSVLAEQVDMAWLVVFQGSKELEDKALMTQAGIGRDHAERVIRWIRTQVDHTAPEALAVGADASSSAAASLPKGLDRISAIPDPIWGPIVAGLLILVTGALALIAGRPWLLPSLGPTAVMAGEMPAHPMSRTWNTTVGHIGGLLAGFAGVLLAGAMNDPVVLVDHVLTPGRVLASVIAIALTVLAGALLRASHPPAAATTLLVSLGSLRTAPDAANLLLGVLVVAIAAAVLRDLRTHRVTPAERMGPEDSYVRRYLRRGSPG